MSNEAALFILTLAFLLSYGTVILIVLLIVGIAGIFSTKKKWPRILLGLTVTLLAIIWIPFSAYQIYNYLNPQITSAPQSIDALPPNTSEADENWKTYTNNQLGFSIEIPKTAKYTLDTLTPITVLEQNNQVAFTLDPETMIDEINIWKISIISISSREQLNQYIKDHYEQGCEINELVPSQQEGVYDVVITGTPPDLPDEERCFVNWLTINKYFPEKGILANWDIGQDANFFNSSGEALDTHIAKSFQFLP